MATLTIRNLEDDIVDRLKVQAKQHGRSLEAEAREILAQADDRLHRRVQNTEFAALVRHLSRWDATP